MTRYLQDHRNVGTLSGTAGDLDAVWEVVTGICLTTDGNLAVTALRDASFAYDRRVMLFTWPGLSLIDANWIDLSAETDMYPNIRMCQGSSADEVVIAWGTDSPAGGSETGPIKFAKFNASTGKTAINSWSGTGGNFTGLHDFIWDADNDVGWAALQDVTFTAATSTAVFEVTSSAVTRLSGYRHFNDSRMLDTRDHQNIYIMGQANPTTLTLFDVSAGTFTKSTTSYNPRPRWSKALEFSGPLPNADGALFDDGSDPSADLGDLDAAGSGTVRAVDNFQFTSASGARFFGHPDHSVLGYWFVSGTDLFLYEFFYDEELPEAGGLRLGILTMNGD